MECNKKRIALVTGGSGGIGSSVSELLAAEKVKVYIVGRNTEKLQCVKNKIKNFENEVGFIKADVTSFDECNGIVKELISREGKLDILINCAGVYLEKPFNEMKISEINKIIDTNLKGTLYMCKSALPYLVKTKGCIVNTSSDAGNVGFHNAVAYCASKGGVNMLTKAIAMEYAPYCVRVNAVCPDMVDTDMIKKDFEVSGFETRDEYDRYNLSSYPQGIENSKYITAKDVAESIVFLASEEKAKAITGICMTIDYGLTAGF